MKLLHIANFHITKDGAQFYSCDRKFNAGFIRNGHTVYDYSYKDMIRLTNFFRSTKIGRSNADPQLLNICAQFQPELIVLGHVNIPPATLAAMRKLLPNTPIISWFVDPLEPYRIDHFKPMAPYIDALFATTAGDSLKALKKQLQCIPIMGYLPNPADSSIDTGKAFAMKTHLYDVVYCGSDRKHPKRAEFLTQVSHKTPDLKWKIAGSLNQPLIYGSEYMQLLQSARFALNLSKFNTDYMYSSDRIGQLTANGLLTFTHYFPGVDKLFTAEEMIYFNDADELIEKLSYFSQHYDEAVTIAKKGYEKAHQCYSSERICRYMTEAIAGNFTEHYEWIDEYYNLN